VRRTRRGLAWLAGLVGVVTALAPAVPAAGHASRELPQAQLSAEGPVATVELQLAADDAAYLGELLGLLPEGSMLAYLEDATTTLPTDAEVAAFSRSEQLRAYLLEHVVITQSGRACAGEALPAADFLHDGAVVRFACPEILTEASVRITLLHEQDPAYRTFSVDGTSQYALHSPRQPEHPWDFTLAAAQDPVPPVLWAGLAGVLVTLSALLVLVPRAARARTRSASRERSA
jgi:hypothetical protein